MRSIRALYFGAGVCVALLALHYVSRLLAAARGDAAGGAYFVSAGFALVVALLAGISFAAGGRASSASGGRLRSLVAGALFSAAFALLVVALESWSGTPLRLVGWEALLVFAAGSFFIGRRATRPGAKD